MEERLWKIEKKARYIEEEVMVGSKGGGRGKEDICG
jgi:hypothetical protein